MGCTAAAGESTTRKRRTRGVWCAHPYDEARTEAAGGEEEAAATFGEVAAWRSGGAPATAKCAPGARDDGDADGVGGEDAASSTAALEAAE